MEGVRWKGPLIQGSGPSRTGWRGPPPPPLECQGSLASSPSCHVQVTKHCYFKVTSAPVSPSESGDENPILGRAVTSVVTLVKELSSLRCPHRYEKHCSPLPGSLEGDFF